MAMPTRKIRPLKILGTNSAEPSAAMIEVTQQHRNFREGAEIDLREPECFGERPHRPKGEDERRGEERNRNPLRHGDRHRRGHDREHDDPEPQDRVRLEKVPQRQADESRIEAIEAEVQEGANSIEQPRHQCSDNHGHDVEGGHPPVEGCLIPVVDSDGNHEQDAGDLVGLKGALRKAAQHLAPKWNLAVFRHDFTPSAAM